MTTTGAVIAGTVRGHPLGVLGGAYRSGDNGASWTLAEDLPGAVNDLASGSGEGLYVGMFGTFELGTGGVYKSTDDGVTWEPTGLIGPDVEALAVRGDGAVFAGVESDEPPSGILRSDDGGQTWEPTGYDAESVTDLVIDAAGTVYAARARRDNRDGVYRTTDDGQTWTLVTGGLDARYVLALFIDRAGYLWAGTSHGAFRSAVPLPVSIEGEGEAPEPFALAPAYPNPSASSAHIPFTLSKAGSVTVAVHDVLGRRVATLVDAVLPAGAHTATWEAGGAASGIYVVTLRAGAQMVTRRITVAR